MDVMISQIVYKSSATVPFLPDDLAQILAVSRQNNARDGITGALLYSGGKVLQAIEGPEAALDDTFERVRADPRHKGVVMLYRGTTEERSFPDWTMGLRTAEELPAGKRDGARSLFDMTRGGPTPGRRLLGSFRDFVR